MQINTLTGTETSPQKLAFSTQGTPSRPRTASSPLAYKRLKTTMTKSTFNAAMLQSPSSSIVYEHTRHNSDIASPEVMAYANQVWINENKGRRPDEKFMSFITEIRKTRKASKKNLRKTMKSLRTPDKSPADVVDAQIIAAKEELERRRKSVGLFETISANKTKKLVREKTFMQIKQKVDQMIYEDSNPGKFVKHLMNVQIDTSALMQPRFQGFDQSAPVSPSMPQSAKTDFKRLVNPTKPLKADEEEVLLQGPKTLSYLKQGNKEVYNKIDIGAVKRYVHISKRSVGSPPLIGPDGTIGVTLSQKTTEKDRERKKLMKIAQGEARGQDGEEEEELDSPQPIPEFIAQAYAMSVKKTKKVGVNERMKAGSTIDELIRKGEQSRIVADFNLRHQHPMMFSYVRELSEFNSEKGSPKMGNSPFGSPMTSATATFRKGQASVPPTQLLSSLFSARSSNITPEMKNGGDLTRKGTTTRAGPEEKPLEIVPLKLAKHKRTDRKELDEREKYHVKVDTYVSPRAVKKSIDTFAQTFYKEKAMDNPKSQLELYNEFKRLTTTCAKNVKSSKRIKRVMRKTFGNLNKNFGKIDMMIEERDVEFERQIKKDIKEDMKSYIPSAALLKMHPSVNV